MAEEMFDLIERADKIRDMANKEMRAAGLVNLADNYVTTAAVLSVIAQTIIYDAEVELARLEDEEDEDDGSSYFHESDAWAGGFARNN